MKKLPKILIILILAAIALNIMLSRYIKEESDAFLLHHPMRFAPV